MQSRWQTTQDTRGDLQTDSATCWERAYVVRSHESAPWSLGCEDACGLCLRITVHCAEPANPWLIYHASELWPQPGCGKQPLTAMLKLSLCLLLFYYSLSPPGVGSASQPCGASCPAEQKLLGAPLMPSCPDAHSPTRHCESEEETCMFPQTTVPTL